MLLAGTERELDLHFGIVSIRFVRVYAVLQQIPVCMVDSCMGATAPNHAMLSYCIPEWTCHGTAGRSEGRHPSQNAMMS